MTYDAQATRAALRAELAGVEEEIARLRLLRSDTTCRLERALKERDRLRRHVLMSSAPQREGEGDQRDRIC